MQHTESIDRFHFNHISFSVFFGISFNILEFLILHHFATHHHQLVPHVTYNFPAPIYKNPLRG